MEREPADVRGWDVPAVLADGTVVRIRAIDAADAPALRAFHASLSERSVYQRYHAFKPELSDAEVAHLTQVDYAARFALVAELASPSDGAHAGAAIVAVARYEQVDADRAEAAFLVRDDLQGLGLGSALLAQLAAAARARGISTFLAETLVGNERMLATFRHSGLGVTISRDGDVLDVVLDLVPGCGSPPATVGGSPGGA